MNNGSWLCAFLRPSRDEWGDGQRSGCKNNNNVKQAKKRITPVIYDPSIYVKTRPNHFSVFI